MKGLLVRVCIDSTCGPWNGPIDLSTGKFIYVPIPESKPLHSRLSRSFDEVSSSLRALGTSLPVGLAGSPAHVDPDFEFLTYGDQGARAKRIREVLGGGHAGFIVFYGGFRDVNSGTIIDAIIGIYHVEDVIEADDLPAARWHENAHTRRCSHAGDVIVRAIKGKSGRLKRGILIGRYRNGAHRVDKALLKAWGDIGVRDGYIQRSVRLPEFLDPPKFLKWFSRQRPDLVAANNYP